MESVSGLERSSSTLSEPSRSTWKEFSQETTWHGIKQITQEDSTIGRKIAWAVVVLTALTAFSYAVSTKVQEYLEHNSQIEVKSNYKTELPFPRVTVCNLNPYKMSALQINGLYDVVTLAYESLRYSKATEARCVESFTLRADICVIPDEAAFRAEYDETTMQVCKHLCTKLEGHRCSGFLYDSNIRCCTLTSFSGDLKDSAQASSCDPSRKFYRRKRCAGGGHFAYLMESDIRPGYCARLETEFFDVARTCIMFAYRIFGDAELNIHVRHEELIDTKVKKSLCVGVKA
ncbi:hypothetical protein CAPTEDRAFT_213607 [Capitella teleta]|uniref:Uncharacterized protein n=1 Tax=Capitella teleta TaxID=283909 RepID=R7VCN1_CAPTE|nr:hypothetical protein CAPTEDRAFT_213607 [Capitella teleta]|eukprot:ELU16389.1 hypothetical protein CAPTEDRAFT_213607 [Capitella teleta]